MKRHPDLQYVLPCHNVMVLSVRHVHACTHFCSVPENSFFSTGPQIPYCEIKYQEQPPWCAVRMKWSEVWNGLQSWCGPLPVHLELHHILQWDTLLSGSESEGIYSGPESEGICSGPGKWAVEGHLPPHWSSYMITFETTFLITLIDFFYVTLGKTTHCFWRKHLYPLIERIKPPAILCLFSDSELLIKYKASEHRKTYWMLNSEFLSI